ncbi:glycosyltransferase [Desulfobacula sp.]|uniref:glycosyltransferase n=1 Tax=Desulfobacula sp. TaxID=2593537 RepID=UPI001ED502AC|nr:hypothetical protein [Desulfobacula sp.]
MKCGWITAPENPKQLTEMIKYVLDQPSEASKKGLKARGKWKRKYCLDVIQEELLKVFDKYNAK